MTNITSCVYYPPAPTYDKLRSAGFQPAQEPPRWRRYARSSRSSLTIFIIINITGYKS
jgi:hypothetical protein